MSTRLARLARMLIALAAVYGFVLHGFGRDAQALARLAPDRIALCQPGLAEHGQPDRHDEAKACALHCLGAIAGTALLVPPSPVDGLERPALDLTHPVAAARAPDAAPWRLAFARGPPPQA